MKGNTYNKNLVYVIAFIAATGGLLFGFDTGVISGAIPFLQDYFGIGEGTIETITTAVLVGAIIGALLGGKLADTLGRRRIILGAVMFFMVGTIWSSFASSPTELIISRLLLGIAIGITSFAVPLYIAEISPAGKRGMLVSLFQLLVTTGILVSYLTDLGFADPSDSECWRWMFLVGIAPALILLVGILPLPETPRWLMQKGLEKESREVLQRIESPKMVEEQMSVMRAEIEKDKQAAGWRELAKPWLHTPLIIAIGIMFFQQFVGINTVIYYSPKIFLMAGFNGTIAAIWASVGVGVINLLSTLVSVWFVDRIGRRKLYTIGMSGLAVSLVLLSLCFFFNNSMGEVGKWASIILVFLYTACFAVSIGPLAWLIISEVFPQKVRGLGSSIGSLSVWVFNALVSFTFFKIVKAFTIPGTEITVDGESLGNPAGAFLFYALIAVAGLVWGYFFVPETKGKSLEQIEDYWRKGGKAKEL